MLMKASVDLKLQSMQSSKILASLGQDFDLYRQFVSNLYDIESKESVLRMKNGETLTIHFSDKKFVGKPQEFASVQTNNLDDLKNIRVEFEIDLDKSSPSSEVEMMLKAIT